MFFSLINCFIFSYFLISFVLSDNLILFFISWVGLNISLYGVLLKSFNSFNIELTLKYFISGSILTIILLFAMLLYYLEINSFSLNFFNYIVIYQEDIIINNALYTTSSLKMIYIIILSLIIFKLGLFPFNFYLIDIYQALDIKKSMVLYTILLKIAVYILFLKHLSNFWYLNTYFNEILIICSLGSILISSICIVGVFKIRNFFANSYLNSIGFVFLAILSGIILQFGELTLYISKVYLFVYLFTWNGILNILNDLKNKFNLDLIFYKDLLKVSETYISKAMINKKKLIVILFYLKNKQSVSLSKLYLLIFLLSLAGFPPMVGFFTKALVYFGMFLHKKTSAILIILYILTPIVSLGYLKIILYIITPINNFYSSHFINPFYTKLSETVWNVKNKIFNKKQISMLQKDRYSSVNFLIDLILSTFTIVNFVFITPWFYFLYKSNFFYLIFFYIKEYILNSYSKACFHFNQFLLFIFFQYI